MGLRRQPLDRFAIGTVLCALLVAGPLIGLPLSFIVAPGALSRVLRPPARGDPGHGLHPGGRGGGHASCSAPRSPRSCPSSSSPGGAGSSGRSCCRSRCPATCSRCSRSGSTCPASARRSGRSAVFTLVLYPYVYLLARAAFLSQSRTLLEAARGLGLSRRAGDPAGGPAARTAGDPRRRCARPDGGARRLRHGQPARRPARSPTRSTASGSSRSTATRRCSSPRCSSRSRSRCSCSSASRAGAPATPSSRRAATSCGPCACADSRPWPLRCCRSRWSGWWSARRSRSSGCGRCSRSGTACSRPSSPRPRATASCSPG